MSGNEGDALWMRAMRELFHDETDPRSLLRWNAHLRRA